MPTLPEPKPLILPLLAMVGIDQNSNSCRKSCNGVERGQDDGGCSDGFGGGKPELGEGL